MKNNLTEIKNKVVKGITSLVLREFVIKAITAFGQLIIIRILSPEEFGIFAIIAFISGFVSLMSDFGLSQAIIQHKKNITQEYLSTVFYIKQFLMTVIVLILVLLAPISSKIYHQINQSGILMLRILLVLYLVDPLNTTILSIIERKLKFYVIPRVDIAGIIAYYLSVIFLASLGFGVWSFVFALVLKKILETLILFFHEPWLPFGRFKFVLVKNSLKFGLYLHFGNILGFFQRSMPTAIGGIVTSSYNVGLLDWSNNVATFANSINENYGRVAFAGFSKIQNNKKILSLAVNKSINYLLLYSIFLTLIVLGFGKEIIYYIASPKWLPALAILQIFTISIVFASMLTVLVQALTAIGKSKEIFYPSLWIIGFGWITGALTSPFFGFWSLAVIYTLVMAALFLAFCVIATKCSIKLSLLKTLKPKLITFTIVMVFEILLNQFNSNFGYFLIKILTSSLFYLLLLYLLDREIIFEAIRLIQISFLNKKKI